MSERAHRPRGLLIIAAFKLLKGLALLAVGIGAHTLMHKDIAAVAVHWVEAFRVDPNNHYIHAALERFTNLDIHKLKQLSIGTFFYSALLLTEGVGLAMGKRWAEYFTIIVTSSLIPLEAYEIFRHTTWVKVLLLLINVAVVAYLAQELRHSKARDAAQNTQEPALVSANKA
jgi:uncharacterized membrane protein (DUF2068 family)